MAEVAYTEELSDQRTQVFKWGSVTESDTFQHLALGANLGEVTIIAGGTFGTGDDVALEGSHDGSTWHKVKDKAGSAITLTAAGYAAARDFFPFMRPSLDAGTGVSVDVTVAVTRGA